DAADAIDLEFGLLCRFLCYTGLRLSEALSRKLRDVQVDRAYLYLPDSKTGEPRGCHLPPKLVQWMRAQPARTAQPFVRDKRGSTLSGQPVQDGRWADPDSADRYKHTIAGVPFLERDKERKLFRFHNGGALRDMLKTAMANASLSFLRRQGGFHVFCHTYG